MLVARGKYDPCEILKFTRMLNKVLVFWSEVREDIDIDRKRTFRSDLLLSQLRVIFNRWCWNRRFKVGKAKRRKSATVWCTNSGACFFTLIVEVMKYLVKTKIKDQMYVIYWNALPTDKSPLLCRNPELPSLENKTRIQVRFA